MKTTKVPTVDNAAKLEVKSVGKMYVSMNEKYYPGSVFKGTCKHKKHFVILTDIMSLSAGDVCSDTF